MFVLNLIKSIQFKVHSLHYYFVPNCTCTREFVSTLTECRLVAKWRYTVSIYIYHLWISLLFLLISLNFHHSLICNDRMWVGVSRYMVPVSIETCRLPMRISCPRGSTFPFAIQTAVSSQVDGGFRFFTVLQVSDVHTPCGPPTSVRGKTTVTSWLLVYACLCVCVWLSVSVLMGTCVCDMFNMFSLICWFFFSLACKFVMRLSVKTYKEKTSWK